MKRSREDRDIDEEMDGAILHLQHVALHWRRLFYSPAFSPALEAEFLRLSGELVETADRLARLVDAAE